MNNIEKGGFRVPDIGQKLKVFTNNFSNDLETSMCLKFLSGIERQYGKIIKCDLKYNGQDKSITGNNMVFYFDGNIQTVNGIEIICNIDNLVISITNKEGEAKYEDYDNFYVRLSK